MHGRILAAIAVLLAICVSPSNAAKRPPLLIYEINKIGDVRRLSDFELVDAPQFLFIGTPIKREDVEIYCSPSSELVIFRAGENLIAINDRKMRNALFDKSDIVILSALSKSNPLRNHPDNVERIVKRAHKQCGRLPADNEIAATDRKTVATGRKYNVLNNMAEAIVVDEMCGRLKVNTVLLSLAASFHGVQGEDIAVGGRYHEQLVDLVQQKRDAMEESAHEEDIVCMTGDLLYGEKGMNVPHLLQPE